MNNAFENKIYTITINNYKHIRIFFVQLAYDLQILMYATLHFKT